jgi:hypothetical protein
MRITSRTGSLQKRLVALRRRSSYCQSPSTQKAFSHIYRVSQEEYSELREGVPYAKVCRCNPKHVCPKLNGYGDNEQTKVWSSGGSMHCTCQLRSLIEVCPWVWCPMTAHTSRKLHICFLQSTSRCAVGHVTSVLAIHVSCIVLGTLRPTTTWRARFFLSSM